MDPPFKELGRRARIFFLTPMEFDGKKFPPL